MKAKIKPRSQIFTIIEDIGKEPKDWRVVKYVQAFNEEHAAEIFVDGYFKKDPEVFFDLDDKKYLTIVSPVFPSPKIDIFIYQIWPGKHKKRLFIIGELLSFLVKNDDIENKINCWFTNFYNLL